ncbi:flavodoxin family protein [Alicyclobacillus tolerans]|uniref:flavodoxin family protein n=1 Tax=Alicyclobacillus tolerans TaxID=90970 RepID=UPI001F1E554B|nr:flavodoxin family protein [Alicyclobacillus tolerans]MCF8565532.1 flavodoxin family protein [Alicyclobacillus tolerans]
MKVCALYGSSRKRGNSELLAEKLLEHLDYAKRYLSDFQIDPIVDQRHVPGGFADVQDDYSGLIRELLDYDILVFVTPVYWYGMSGRMKNFVDRWSQSLRDKSLSFKEKMQKTQSYVVIVGGDDPQRKSKPLVEQFEFIFDFMGMQLEGIVVGDGNEPGDVLNDQAAMQTAAKFNAKLRRMAGM